jgi:putative ABC transport system substrate-binding protein
MKTANRSYRLVRFILFVTVLGLWSGTEAQQNKIRRIGYLAFAAKPSARDEAFKQGLRELGYTEGKNINIEYRYAGGASRVPGLAKELVGLKVDVLLVSGVTVAEETRKVTATIPIVIAGAGNPIGSGLVASLARPGGNVTGLYQFSPELIGKRLEVLKEVLPQVKRFAFLTGTDAPAAGCSGGQSDV